MEGEPQPRASRPDIPDYGIPDTPEGLLPWSWARERLEQALTYWIATVRPEGRPHVMPSWGAWVGDRFYFEGESYSDRFSNRIDIGAAPFIVGKLNLRF